MAAGTVDLRCTCSKRPLLGVGGRDRWGKPFVHVKVFKQGRVYGEIVTTGGTTRIRCRECSRWFSVTIVSGAIDLEATTRPEVIDP